MTITRLQYVFALGALAMTSLPSARTQQASTNPFNGTGKTTFFVSVSQPATGLMVAMPAAAQSQAPDDSGTDGISQVHAKSLTGIVHMASQGDMALARVLVEECDANWGRVLASTKTDYQGRFKLKPGRRGKIHYLRLSAQGFQTRQYEVILSSDAPGELTLELHLASKSQSRRAWRPRGNSLNA